MSGQMEKLDVDLSGLLSSPRLGMEVSPLNSLIFIKSKRSSIAELFRSRQKTASRRCSRLTSPGTKNEFHLRGIDELPRDIHDLGRAPASMELAATLRICSR